MSLKLSINGEADIIKFYNITRLEIEDFDISSYDLESKEDLRELYELVNNFVESGEADIYDIHTEIHGVNPNTCRLKIKNGEEKTVSLDEVTLKNISLRKSLKDIVNANIGDVFVVKAFKGGALWDFDSDIEEENIDPKLLEIGYFDCSTNVNQYDVLEDELYLMLCDTVSTDYIRYKGEKFELADFVFNPMKILTKIYVVKEDPESGVKILEKVQAGGERLSDTNMDIDDFEEN